MINIARGVAPGAGGEEDMETDEGGIAIQSAAASATGVAAAQVQHHVQLCRSLSENVQREQGMAHERYCVCIA